MAAAGALNALGTETVATLALGVDATLASLVWSSSSSSDGSMLSKALTVQKTHVQWIARIADVAVAVQLTALRRIDPTDRQRSAHGAANKPVPASARFRRTMNS